MVPDPQTPIVFIMGRTLDGPGKLPQKANVILGIKAKVIDPIFELADTFDPHAEGESGVFAAIDAKIIEHFWMEHSAAEDFDPAGVFADAAAGAAANQAAYVHFRAGFGE